MKNNGLKGFFNRQSVDINPQELDLHLEGTETTHIKKNTITREQAIGLPSVYTNVELISNVISNLEVKLYKELQGSVEEVKGDIEKRFKTYEIALKNGFMTHHQRCVLRKI